MSSHRRHRACGAVIAVTVMAGGASAGAQAPTCVDVSGTMTEARSTASCRDARKECFTGTVDAGSLRGTTYFHGDSSGTPPPASPGFTPYGGFFEYTTADGVLRVRETGIVSGQEGVVTAYQKVSEGTGRYAGATGHLFVSGTTTGERVVTTLRGRICRP